jgi:nicotinamide-nucleotide amidase
VKAIIISIGSELLRGDIVDTNAAYLAREISPVGFEVVRVDQVGDNLDRLRSIFVSALTDADIVIATGGLGPTEDDVTRQAIAAALGEELYHDPGLLSTIEARFASMGRPMTKNNQQQALLIPSAEAIPNPNGTAPGWYVRWNGKVVVAMPGPPGEMEPMWTDEVLPRLEQLLPGSVATLALMTFGLGESWLEDRIAHLLHSHPNVTVATYAKSAGVQVHVTARADSPEEAERLLTEMRQQLQDRLGSAIFAVGERTLADVVGEMLDDRGLTLAVMESCTGGDLANLITTNDGSSEHFLGSIVAYSRDVKAAYGVDERIMNEHGLISAETACSMARAATQQLHADVGMSTTGIAGMESVEGRPPGTCFVAVSLNGHEEVREIHRPAPRPVAKRYFAQCALDLLRQQLLAAQKAGP